MAAQDDRHTEEERADLRSLLQKRLTEDGARAFKDEHLDVLIKERCVTDEVLRKVEEGDGFLPKLLLRTIHQAYHPPEGLRGLESSLERLQRLERIDPPLSDEEIVKHLVTTMEGWKIRWSNQGARNQATVDGTVSSFGQRWQLVEREGQVLAIVRRWHRVHEEQRRRLTDSASNSALQYQVREGPIILILGPPGSGKTRLVDSLPGLVMALPAGSILNDGSGAFMQILQESMAEPEPLQYFMDLARRDFSIGHWHPLFDWLASKAGRWLGLLSLLMYLDKYRKGVGLADVLSLLPERVVVSLEAHHVWFAMHKLRGLPASFIHLAMDEASVLRGAAKEHTRVALSQFPLQVGRLASTVSVALSLCSTRLMGSPPTSGVQGDSPVQGGDRADDAATRRTESDLIDRATSSGDQGVTRVFLTPISKEAARTLFRKTCLEAGFEAPERLPKAVLLTLEYASARPRLLEMAIAAMSRSEKHDELVKENLREFVQRCTYGRLMDTFVALRNFIQHQEYYKNGENRFGEGRTRQETYKELVVSSLRGCKHPAKALIVATSKVTWADAVESGHVDNTSDEPDYVRPWMPLCIMETFLAHPVGNVLRPLLNLFGNETAWYNCDDKEITDLGALLFQIKLLQLMGGKTASMREILSLPPTFADDHPMEWPLRLEGLNLEDQRLRTPWSEDEFEDQCAKVANFYMGSKRTGQGMEQSAALSGVAGSELGGWGQKGKRSASAGTSASGTSALLLAGVSGAPNTADNGASRAVCSAEERIARLCGPSEAVAALSGDMPGVQLELQNVAPNRRPTGEGFGGGGLGGCAEREASFNGGVEGMRAKTGTDHEVLANELREEPYASTAEGLVMDGSKRGTLGKSVRSLFDTFEDARPETGGSVKEGEPGRGRGLKLVEAGLAPNDAQGVPLFNLDPTVGTGFHLQTGGLSNDEFSEPASQRFSRAEDEDETSESGPSGKRRYKGEAGDGVRKKPRRVAAPQPGERVRSPDKGRIESSRGGLSPTLGVSGLSEGVGMGQKEELVAESPAPEKRRASGSRKEVVLRKGGAQSAPGKSLQSKGPTVFFQGAPKAERPDAFAFLVRAKPKDPKKADGQRSPANQRQRNKRGASGKVAGELRILRAQLQSKSSIAPRRAPLSSNAFKALITEEAQKMYSPQHPCSLLLLCMDKPEPKGMSLAPPNVVVLDRTRWRNLYLELGNFKRGVYDLLEALRSADPPSRDDPVAGYHCPEETCRKSPYILRSRFVQHLRNVHQMSEAEASELAQAAEMGLAIE